MHSNILEKNDTLAFQCSHLQVGVTEPVTSRQCECTGLAQPILELYDTVVHPTSSDTQAPTGCVPPAVGGPGKFKLPAGVPKFHSKPTTLTNVGDGIDKANLSF